MKRKLFPGPAFLFTVIILAVLISGAGGLLACAAVEDAPIYKTASSLGIGSNPDSDKRRFVVNTIPPRPDGLDIYVNDASDLQHGATPLLDPDDVETLKSRLQAIDEAGIAQMSVLILPDTDHDLSEFAPQIMNRWGIQHQGKKDGLLVLINAARLRNGLSGNRIFIAPSYNLEGILPDAVVGRILDTYAVPAFEQREFSTGITRATLAIANILTEGKSLKHPRARQDGPPVKELLFFMVILFILSKLFRNGGRGGGGGFWGGGYYGGFGGGFGGSDFGGGGGFSGGFGGSDDSSGGGGAGR